MIIKKENFDNLEVLAVLIRHFNGERNSNYMFGVDFDEKGFKKDKHINKYLDSNQTFEQVLIDDQTINSFGDHNGFYRLVFYETDRVVSVYYANPKYLSLLKDKEFYASLISTNKTGLSTGWESGLFTRNGRWARYSTPASLLFQNLIINILGRVLKKNIDIRSFLIKFNNRNRESYCVDTAYFYLLWKGDFIANFIDEVKKLDKKTIDKHNVYLLLEEVMEYSILSFMNSNQSIYKYEYKSFHILEFIKWLYPEHPEPLNDDDDESTRYCTADKTKGSWTGDLMAKGTDYSLVSNIIKKVKNN